MLSALLPPLLRNVGLCIWGIMLITCMLTENASAQAGWTCLTPEAKSSTLKRKLVKCITTVSSGIHSDPEDAVKNNANPFSCNAKEEPDDKENLMKPTKIMSPIFSKYPLVGVLYTASAEKYCNGQNQGFQPYRYTYSISTGRITQTRDNLGWTDGNNGDRLFMRHMHHALT